MFSARKKRPYGTNRQSKNDIAERTKPHNQKSFVSHFYFQRIYFPQAAPANLVSNDSSRPPQSPREFQIDRPPRVPEPSPPCSQFLSRERPAAAHPTAVQHLAHRK